MELVADLALAEAPGAEFGDFLGHLLVIDLVAVAPMPAGRQEVGAFGAGAFEAEPEEIAGFDDAAEGHIVVAVDLCGAALFYLFDVAEMVVGAAFADGEGAVGKVDEEFAAVEVVGREGCAGVAAFGCVGEHEDGQVVLRFEGFEVLHEAEGDGGVFGTAAQAGDVVDNEDGGFDEVDLVFDAVEEEIVVDAGVSGEVDAVIGVEFGAEEAVVKVVAALLVGVALVKLAGAELEVDIEDVGLRGVEREGADGPAAGDAVGDLYGEDGFADVGIGKEDAKFALVPERAEEHFGFGLALAEVHPAVSGAYGEEVAGLVEVGLGWCGGFAGGGAQGEAAYFGAELFDVEGAFGGHGSGEWSVVSGQ